MQHATDIEEVLNQQRLVEAELMAQFSWASDHAVLAGQGFDWVAGYEADHDECQQRHPDEGWGSPD